VSPIAYFGYVSYYLPPQAGFFEFLAMFNMGYFVVILTVLSVAALATNGEMKGGGQYYLISRVSLHIMTPLFKSFTNLL